MKRSNYLLKSFMSAGGVFIYTSGVAWLLFNGEAFFGRVVSFLMPLVMLLLLVISATVTGFLVLGRPTHLYLNGMKKEALILLFATVGWLILFAATLILALSLQQ